MEKARGGRELLEKMSWDRRLPLKTDEVSLQIHGLG